MFDYENSHYHSTSGPSGSTSGGNQRNDYMDRDEYSNVSSTNMSRQVQNQDRPLLPMPMALPKPIPARRDDRSPSPAHYSSQQYDVLTIFLPNFENFLFYDCIRILIG